VSVDRKLFFTGAKALFICTPNTALKGRSSTGFGLHHYETAVETKNAWDAPSSVPCGLVSEVSY